MFDLLGTYTTALSGPMAAGSPGYGAASMAITQPCASVQPEATGATTLLGGPVSDDLRFLARGNALQLAAWCMHAPLTKGAVILVDA